MMPAAIDPRSPEALAAKWWHEDGRQIDPDSHCDDWEIKRRELAQIAFVAGFKAAPVSPTATEPTEQS